MYLSFCLALLAAAARRGVWLPLVLDDPFLRLDAHAMASVAAVLEAFSRQGHQVIIFTGQQAAAQRLTSLGVAVRDIASLRYLDTGIPVPALAEVSEDLPITRGTGPEKRRPARREGSKRKKLAPHQPRNGKASEADRSDAA